MSAGDFAILSASPPPSLNAEAFGVMPNSATSANVGTAIAAGTIRVPEDYATIQEAIDAAADGATILVGPGTYTGGINIAGKSITLTSLYEVNGDRALIDQTIISGGSAGIYVDVTAPNTTVKGFHFVGNSRHSVKVYGEGGQILDNFFDDPGAVAISFRKVGGVISGNRISGPGDDGIDIRTGAGNALIENNTVEGSRDDGVDISNRDSASSPSTLTVRNNTITASGDEGIDIDVGGGDVLVENNTVEGSRDDGVDVEISKVDSAGSPSTSTIRNNTITTSGDEGIDICPGGGDLLIESNTIERSGDDGVEINDPDSAGSPSTSTIRNNTITTSGDEGIQITGYAANSDRMFVIERNLIVGSADVGLGVMDNGETIEDSRAASVPERIYVFNNTFDGNKYGITGGDNLVAVNNIITNSSVIGVKNVDGASTVAYSLFFGNGADHVGSNVDATTTIAANPLYTNTYGLQAGSPAIDAGTVSFVYNSQTVLDIPPSQYSGITADLGWSEFIL